MFSNSVLQLLAIIFASIFQIDSDCRESYVTFCDKYSDVVDKRGKLHPKAHEWTELIIGSDANSFPDFHQELFIQFPFDDFTRLRTLTLLGGQMRLRTGTIRRYRKNGLQTLNWYGFRIGTLKSDLVPRLCLRELILRKNGITSLEKGALLLFTPEYLDLSDNYVEEIREETLTFGSKIIKLKYNKIMYIEKNAFPSNLEVLNLDHNNLRSLQGGVFENLVNLQELTLSYNKFYSLSRLDSLEKLKVLDLSHNNFEEIEESFLETFSNMKILDLSHNQIEFSYRRGRHFLNFIRQPPKNGNMRISLAFNRLDRLPVNLNSTIAESTPHNFGYKLNLYGNPWNCTYFRTNEKFFKQSVDKCDMKFFNSGETPVCVVDFQSSDEILGTFLQAAKPDSYDKECDFSFRKAVEIYPIKNNTPCMFTYRNKLK